MTPVPTLCLCLSDMRKAGTLFRRMAPEGAAVVLWPWPQPWLRRMAGVENEGLENENAVDADERVDDIIEPFESLSSTPPTKPVLLLLLLLLLPL
jgi:hypothetical protein